jgi:hypothetical protein
MLIYCDTNVYYRPFNDQTPLRIRREAIAFATIIEWVEKEKIGLLKSEILEFEIEQTRDSEIRSKVQTYLRLCKYETRATDEQLALAQKLEKECGFKGRDALHIAAACLGKAMYCVSCDDRMTKRVDCCAKVTRENGFQVTVINPEELVKLWQREETSK